MTAILAMVKIVPSWCWWLLIVVALCIGSDLHGAGRVQKRWDLQQQHEKDVADSALKLRQEENAAQAADQALRSANIQKGSDDEMDKLRADLRNSERLRLGTAWCDGGQSPRATEAGSAGSGNEANTASRVLSAEMDRAVKSLMLEMEEVASTGRAAQEFIKVNGMSAGPDTK